MVALTQHAKYWSRTFRCEGENRKQRVASKILKRNGLERERFLLLPQMPGQYGQVESSLVKVPVVQNVLNLETVLKF